MNKKIFSLIGILLLVVGVIVYKCHSGYKGNSFESMSYEELYFFLSKNEGNSDEYKHAKDIFFRKCKEKGYVFVAEHFSNQWNNKILQELVDTVIISKLNEYDFRQIYDIAPGFKGTMYQKQIADFLKFKALDMGVVEMSMVYSLHTDDVYDASIEELVIEMLPSISLKEEKSILPYYKDTDYYDVIKSDLVNKIRKIISDEKEARITAIETDLSKCGEGMEQDLDRVYDSFLGGWFGVKNWKNSFLRSKESRQNKFMEIWASDFHKEKYEKIFAETIERNNKLFNDNCNKLLNDIGLRVGEEWNKKIALSPDLNVMQRTCERRQDGGWKDIAMGTVDIVTIPVGGKLNILISGTEIGIDILLSQTIFKDPKEYFVCNELRFLNNQLSTRMLKLNEVITNIENGKIEKIAAEL